MSLSRPVRIERTSIAEQLERVVLERILDGSLPAGSRINESHLAVELGVSRTPLREALSRLNREGLVVSRPHRGFFVADLSAAEAHELYECLALLESAALDMAGPPDRGGLSELEELNREIAATRDVPALIDLNTRWHRALLAPCRNAQLLELVEAVRTRVHRYEFAYFAPGASRARTSSRLHRRILDSLVAGEMPAAREALVAHWFTDLDELAPRPRGAADREEST